MSKIVFAKDYVILASCNRITAHSISCCQVRHNLHLPKIVEAAKDPEKPSRRNIDDGPEIKDSGILCLVACKCGSHLAACSNNKQLIVWKVGENFTVMYSRNLQRKSLCLAFVQDCRYILVADKTGDVIRFDLESPDSCEKGKLLLGHLSIILDIALTPEEQFIITCDRDEKIRVSCYPNCYNIHSYCLGHLEFVIKLSILPNLPNVLLSGSGDGTLRFWELHTGKEIGLIHCEEHLSQDYLTKLKEPDDEDPREGNRPHHDKDKPVAVSKLTCNSKNIIAVIYHRLPLVGIYKYEFSTNVKRINCIHDEYLSLSLPPSDICFDNDNKLWVLSWTKVAFVQAYHYQDGKYVLYDEVGTTLYQVIKIINRDSEFFKDSLHMPSIIPSLYKQWYDNVSEYLSSKDEKRKKKNAKMQQKEPDFANLSKKQRCT